MRKEPEWYKILRGGFTGTMAGITVTAIGHPFDTLKVRLQVQSSTNQVYSGLIDCFLKTIKWEGVQGLYKGVMSPLAGQLFIRTILFSSFYESLGLFRGHYETHKESIFPFFAAGSFAGFCVTFADSPVELIIREKTGKPLETKYRNVWHVGQYIYNNYGIRGIFQGYGPMAVRNIIGYCLYFGFFEYFKKIFMSEGETASTISQYKIIAAGALGGIIFWTSVYNFDCIKSAMMADHIERDKRIYRNMLDCGRKLIAEEGGYLRLWKGYSPCLMRSAPANGIMLLVVDMSRKYFPEYP